MNSWGVRLVSLPSRCRSVVEHLIWATLLTLWISLSGMCSPIALTPEDGRSSSSYPSVVAGPQLSLSGWFHVVWNGEPRYVLVDDQGRWIELLLDEALVRPFGGPLAFNRKRVRIEGERVHAPSGGVRVLSISFE